MFAPKNRREFGRIGEDIAAGYLCAKGYAVIERNYRREGAEVDIVCRSPEGCLVFVEVKTRTRGTFGEGFESVGCAKQARIARTSMSYICENDASEDDIRYDVISITLGGSAQDNSIKHIINAFDASSFLTK